MAGLSSHVIGTEMHGKILSPLLTTGIIAERRPKVWAVDTIVSFRRLPG
jgi:hypothetical protein